MLWVVFCVMISWVNGQKYENLLQFNTNWLASLSTWYYFRLCFSFSCSSYDLSLLKKSHTLNCYPFVQKFFIGFYKLILGNCGSSINKVSYVKVLYFTVLRGKNKFSSKKWWGEGRAGGRGGAGAAPATSPPPFLYSPVCKFFMFFTYIKFIW